MTIEKTKTDQYVEKTVLSAISSLLSADKEKEVNQSADIIAKEFGAVSPLFTKKVSDFDTKLVASFQKNLTLLIQKTWVEKSDASLKDQVLYQLSEYCNSAKAGSWQKAYPQLFQIISNVVYLMFGPLTKTEEFSEYAFRIDPEFGTFWYYISSLPQNPEWSQEKCRTAMQLGMYFLANY